MMHCASSVIRISWSGVGQGASVHAPFSPVRAYHETAAVLGLLRSNSFQISQYLMLAQLGQSVELLT
jgi:hypothetical protein